MKAGHGNQVGGKMSHEWAKESETPPSQLLGIQQKLQTKTSQHVCTGPGADPCRRHDCCSSLMSPA